MPAPLRRFRLGKAVICAGIGVVGALAALNLRYAGLLESAELYAYDKFIQWRAHSAPATTDQFALVEETEKDIETYDYPLTDAMLASVLTKIEKQHPAAIGLDLYRDLLEPRNDTAGRETLDAILKNNKNIICAYKFGNGPGIPHPPYEIPPPIPLSETYDQVGFNNFPTDDDTVRRAILRMRARWKPYDSFAVRLARFKGVVLSGTEGLIRIGGFAVDKLTPNTGGYVNAKTGGYQYLVDYKGPRLPLPYSIQQVLEDAVPATVFTGKIVLVGQGAESVNDDLATPLNPSVPGVEMHALEVDQLMRMQNGERAMRAWGGPAQVAWLFLWCAIAVGIGYHCRAPMAFISAPIGMVLILTYSCWRAFEAGWWIPLVPPLAGSLPVTAMVVSYLGYQEEKDRRTLMSIFRRHVDKGVADWVWDQRELFMRDERLIPQCLTATVLFTDLQNFSTVSERMEPEALLAWINEYMEMIVGYVEEYGGMVNKYMGDSIMAVFGAPLARTHQWEVKRDAVNAVSCAIAMGKALDQLNIQRRQAGQPTTNMRVGIHTGPAVSGSIGSCERLEFTVLGDTVNTASRLESFDKTRYSDQSCRILIGEDTRDLLEDQFHLIFVETIELKGQHEKTDIYHVPRDENNEKGALDRRAHSAALSGGVAG